MFKNLLTQIHNFEQLVDVEDLKNQTAKTSLMAQILLIEAPFFILMNRSINQVEYVSESFLTLKGISKNEITQSRLLAFIHPKDLPIYQQSKIQFETFLSNLPANERPFYKYRFNYRIQTKGDVYTSILHQEINFYFIDKENKTITLSLLIFNDVSELKSDTSQQLSFIGLENRPSYYNIDIISETPHQKHSLSVRESEIAKLIHQGKNRSQIARELNISIHTVDTHKRKILAKIGAKNIKDFISKF